ncbi:MAG: hypothetical protein ACXADY_06315 [Candidatus Hodarchaeales archaeon]|jgi:hypothetical protein
MAFSFEIKELGVDMFENFIQTPPEAVCQEFFVNIDFVGNFFQQVTNNLPR